MLLYFRSLLYFLVLLMIIHPVPKVIIIQRCQVEILSRQEISLLDTPKSGSLHKLYIVKLCMLVGMATPYRTLKLPKRMSCVAAGDPGILSIPDTVSLRGGGGTTQEDSEYSGHCVWGMYGGTTQKDPEYPGILSIPNTVCVEVVCMGGQLGRIPSIPGYLVFRTMCVWGVCMGGQLGRIPSIPGYLRSILDTVRVGEYVRGDKFGGSQVSWGAFIDTVCMWRVHI